MDDENTHSNNAQTKPALTLAHLPDICLEKILTNLGIKDLTQAADAEIGLTNSAIHVFKMKFKDERIEYTHDQNELFSKRLKYFGPFISKCEICGSHTSETDIAKIFDSVVECCGPTLTKLTVYDIDYKFELSHRFSLVRSLPFYSSMRNAINDSWADLNQYFPSLRTLEFCYSFGTRVLNPLFRAHYPSLQKIIIIARFLTMAQILNANPQITSLKITPDDFDADSTAFESNVNWFSLNVTNLDIEGVRISQKYVAQLRHLRSLSFDTSSFQTTVLPLKQPII